MDWAAAHLNHIFNSSSEKIHRCTIMSETKSPDNEANSTSAPSYDDTLVQYIIMRKDLTKMKQWYS
jgi:hypothetical protein